MLAVFIKQTSTHLNLFFMNLYEKIETKVI